MQIEAKDLIPKLEEAGAVCCFDIEATGTRGDYNTALVISVKPWHKDPRSFVVKQPGHDSKIVREAKEEMEKYLIWVGYYSKGFDKPFLNTRLIHHGMKPLEDRHHVDLYYQLKSKLLTARKSQAHLLEFFGTPMQKMTLSPTLWNLENPEKDLKVLKARCESDCAGLENLWDLTKHLVRDITK